MREMHPAELRRRLYWASDRWPEHLSLRSIAFMPCSNVEVGSFWELLICVFIVEHAEYLAVILDSV